MRIKVTSALKAACLLALLATGAACTQTDGDIAAPADNTRSDGMTAFTAQATAAATRATSHTGVLDTDTFGRYREIRVLVIKHEDTATPVYWERPTTYQYKLVSTGQWKDYAEAEANKDTRFIWTQSPNYFYDEGTDELLVNKKGLKYITNTGKQGQAVEAVDAFAFGTNNAALLASTLPTAIPWVYTSDLRYTYRNDIIYCTKNGSSAPDDEWDPDGADNRNIPLDAATHQLKFPMKHACARVRVTFKSEGRQLNPDTDQRLAMAFRLKTTDNVLPNNTNWTFNALTGEWTGTKGAEIKFYIDSYTTISASPGSLTYDILLPPFTTAGDLTWWMNLVNSEASPNETFTVTTAKEKIQISDGVYGLEAGKQYDFTFTLTDHVMILPSLTIKDTFDDVDGGGITL